MTTPDVGTRRAYRAAAVGRPNWRRRSPATTARLIAFYGVMTAMGCVFLIPYVLTLFAAFKPIQQIFGQPP